MVAAGWSTSPTWTKDLTPAACSAHLTTWRDRSSAAKPEARPQTPCWEQPFPTAAGDHFTWGRKLNTSIRRIKGQCFRNKSMVEIPGSPNKGLPLRLDPWKRRHQETSMARPTETIPSLKSSCSNCKGSQATPELPPHSALMSLDKWSTNPLR